MQREAPLKASQTQNAFETLSEPVHHDSKTPFETLTGATDRLKRSAHALSV